MDTVWQNGTSVSCQGTTDHVADLWLPDTLDPTYSMMNVVLTCFMLFLHVFAYVILQTQYIAF